MSTDALLQTEQQHHQQAFEHYYGLGNSRTYAQVAEVMHVSIAAVKIWGRAFHWQQRVRERDADAARELADRTLQAARSHRERRRKVIEMALMKLARAIAEDRVKLRATDLDRLIRLEQYLDECEGNRKPETPEEIISFFDEWNEETYRAVYELYHARSAARAKKGEEP